MKASFHVGLVGLWAICALQPAAHAGVPDQLAAMQRGPAATVAAVLDGTTLRLDEPHGTVRLAGLWPGAAAAESDAEAAAAFLRRIAAGKRVQLFLDARQRDRHGHWLAQVVVEGDAGAEPAHWLQGTALRAGAARVYTTLGTDALAAEMLALEQAARAAGRGLWAMQEHAVRDAEFPGSGMAGFQIAECAVKGVHAAGDTTYINFGADWRTDLTVMILRSDLRNFPGRLKAIEGWKGQRLRVRGWVFRLNGPAIRADHAAQIEVVR